MAKTKHPDFYMGDITVGRLDGSSEPVTVPFTPSSVVRTNIVRDKGSLTAKATPGYVQAYYSLAAAGVLADLGYTVPDDIMDPAAIDEAVLELFDANGIQVDTSGGGDDEEDPTSAS